MKCRKSTAVDENEMTKHHNVPRGLCLTAVDADLASDFTFDGLYCWTPGGAL